MRLTPLQPPTPARRPAPPRRPGRGFSVVEALVSAVIVALMLVASLNLLGGAARSRASDNDRRSGLMLAQQLMSEIQQQQYKDEDLTALLFGPELGETTTTTRIDFDDVDDYHNFTEKPVALKDGTTIAGFEAWRRTVKVVWVAPDTLAESLTDTGLVLIEVTVTDPRDKQVSVVALRSQHAAAADPATSGTSLMWTGIELISGGGGSTATRRTVGGVQTVAQPAVK